MHRFVICAWQPDQEQDRAVAQLLAPLAEAADGWQTALAATGLRVLVRGFGSGRAQVYPLATRPATAPVGVVLGKLFPRRWVERYRIGDSPPSEPALGPADARAVLASGGQSLVEQYWGRYVAAWTGPQPATHHVLRDPSGTLPCFFTEQQGCAIFFSHMADCVRLVGAQQPISWPYVARYLHFELDQGSGTGLEQVSSLLPGACRSVANGTGQTRLVWRSAAIARDRLAEPAAAAAPELRRTAVACIGAWASCFQHRLLRLSGGLDSALVLSCLVQSGHAGTTQALHYVGQELASEERSFARLAAEQAGVELLERPIAVPQLDSTRLALMPCSAVPLDYHYGLGAARLDAELADETRAEAFFSGHGGDELLYATSSAYSAVDHALHHGPARSWLTAAMDAALLSRSSLWSVLGLVLRHVVLQRPCDPFAAIGPIEMNLAFTPALQRSLDVREITSPQLAGADLPPAKLLHLFAVHGANMVAMLAPQPVRVEQVHPLYSQPLLELCLRLPTEVLACGGVNRGLARHAFLGAVPALILGRASKGSGDAHHERIARQHLGLIRDRLLDGALVRQRLLDRPGLAQILSGDRSAGVASLAQLLGFVYLEDWLSRWG